MFAIVGVIGVRRPIVPAYSRRLPTGDAWAGELTKALGHALDT